MSNWKCTDCGTEFGPKLTPCPKCHSARVKVGRPGRWTGDEPKAPEPENPDVTTDHRRRHRRIEVMDVFRDRSTTRGASAATMD